MFDVTRRSTFDAVKTQWVEEIKNYDSGRIPFILCGSKIEIRDNIGLLFIYYYFHKNVYFFNL